MFKSNFSTDFLWTWTCFYIRIFRVDCTFIVLNELCCRNAQTKTVGENLTQGLRWSCYEQPVSDRKAYFSPVEKSRSKRIKFLPPDHFLWHMTGFVFRLMFTKTNWIANLLNLIHIKHINVIQYLYSFCFVFLFFQIVCKAVAMLSHYLTLVGFMWFLIEAVMLYLKLISVFAGESVRMKNLLLLGWGMLCI